MDIVKNFIELRNRIPEHVKLVAVSKFKPLTTIRELYSETGHVTYGESRVQELTAKAAELPLEMDWHFIGHLQTNKVKFIVPFISMIESIDSYKLLKEVNREAEKNGRIIKVLLQFHIASEESKFGFDFDEVKSILDDEEFYRLSNIKLAGVMGMASFTDDHSIVRAEFSELRTYYDKLKNQYFDKDPGFREISMGMSGDYPIAIEEGSTMVRIGSLIFGER